MNIKKKLTLGFAAVIVVSLLIIGTSMAIMTAQRNGYLNVINHEIMARELMTECRMYANIAARNICDMAIRTNHRTNDELEAQAYEALDNLDASLKELEGIYDDPNLDEYIRVINEWGNNLPNVFDAIDNDRGDEAVLLIKNKCTPLLNEMAAYAQVIDETLTLAENDAIAARQRSGRITVFAQLAVLLIAAVCVMFMAMRLIKDIVVPVAEVRTALIGYSKGDLSIPVEYESKNELGEMCQALRTSQTTLAGAIGDACYMLEEMAHGNFDVSPKAEELFVGVLDSLLQSIKKINGNLSDTLAQIDLSAEQVSAGSEQVSTGAQALAQGATEQASAVQELSATITEISDNAKKNSKDSETAMSHTRNAGDQVAESSHYMEEMVAAMGSISQSSQEIGRIISTIENIAFQTNILALNAAVEAARAGSAGKGFAVVADEVRNLATKSDQAAKATKELIDRSVESVQNGNEIVKKVSDSLNRTVEATGLAVESLQQITKAVENEAQSIAQVTEGIDQISSVVQTNSATSEQSAAASEELSSQAALMKELMAKFKLRTQEGYASPVVKASADETADSGDEPAVNAFSKY